MEDTVYQEVNAQNTLREIHLQAQWSHFAKNKKLISVDGLIIEVESVGIWNTQKGPDFLNARLIINGHTRIGDIEIHRRATDWYNHKHDESPDYKQVILHVVCELPTGKIPPITTVMMSMPNEDAFSLERNIEAGECASFLLKMPDDKITAILEAYGEERFMLKSELFARLMTTYGKEYSTMYLLFDAAGYKNNREPFKQLFHTWQSYDPSLLKTHFESILWGESGLLPDLAIRKDFHNDFFEFIQNQHTTFAKLRKTHRTPPTFERSGARPMNSPERRLTALIAILKESKCAPLAYWGKEISSTPYAFIQNMLEKLVIHDSLFDHFWNFKTRAQHPLTLQGSTRALDILLNVIVIALHSEALIEHNQQRALFVKTLWKQLPATQENQHLKIAKKRCFGPSQEKRAKKIINHASVQQGLLHLYTNFCDANQSVCRTCRMINIGEKI